MDKTAIVYEPFRSRPLTDFYEELRFEYLNLPDQLFAYYLVRAAITMAREGNLIRRRAIITAQPGVTRYRLESPDGLEVSAVLGIQRGNECGCGTQTVIRSFDPPADAHACSRQISWYDPQDRVIHIDSSCCHGRYYVSLAVAPAKGACELPEVYYTDYLPALLMGTRGYILLITGRPWTNLQLGQAYSNRFAEMIAEHAIEVATKRQRGAVTMQFGRVM